MVILRIISATGRLKNKIEISYRIINTTVSGPSLALGQNGIVYGTTNNLSLGTMLTSTNSGYGDFTVTFSSIPNGRYFVWVVTSSDEFLSGNATKYYSDPMTVFVTDKGYEIATTGITIANPLVIAEGTEGVDKVLTSDSSGLSKWKPIKSLFTFGHYIGELYGGGIVVDVWKEAEDEKVLIASLDDLTFDYYNGDVIDVRSQFDWSTGVAGTTAIGSGAQSLYNGRQNTDAIVAQSIALGTVYNKNGYAGSAAQVCAEYRGGGYEDWYLPAYYELNAIYNQSAILNKVFGYENVFGPFNLDIALDDIQQITYWSSTEVINPSGSSRYAYTARLGNMAIINKIEPRGYLPKIRAVRKESIYTGDGLCLALDTTNIKSFNDVSFKSGQECRWVDLVNGGMTSSYSFNLSAYPTTPTGGTIGYLLADLTTGGTLDSLAYRKMGNWGFTKISQTNTPTLYNNTGESSLVSDYFSVGAYGYLQFETIDQSNVKSSVRATINVYVSIDSGSPGAYTLIRQITNTVGDNNNASGGSPINISLAQFSGKTISIKITAPNAYYVNTSEKYGPSVDNLYVRTTTGGYQPTGPLYLPTESGFLRFNGTGSNTNSINYTTSFGSYVNFKAPIGLATTVTIEMWVRIRSQSAGILFGWRIYDVLVRNDSFGFNTGNGDVYGISAATVQRLKMIDTWAHCVFEMRSDVSYTNNKIYINGDLQTLSAQIAPYGTGGLQGVETSANRNFNGGVGKIGGWGLDPRYMFNGDISVFRVYNRALTKDEIMKNYSTEKKRYEILPKLLENNLFTSIDFDNIASFSGDGTITREVVDLSGNSRSASLIISGTTTKPSVRRTNSLYNGRELVFPGEIATNPYLSWPDSVAIQSLQNISVSFWIKIGINRPSEIIVKWNSSTGTIGPWEVYQSSNTTIAIRLKGQLSSAPYQVDRFGSKQIALNKWTHVCAIYDHTNLKIKTYIDSVLDIDSSAPFGFSISTGITGEICVGRYVTADNQYNFYPFRGSIASIQIYNKSLTSGEIKNNYDADKFRFDNFNDANKFYSHELNGNPTFSIVENLVLDVAGKSNDMILRSDSEGKASWVDKSYFFNRPTNYRYIGELYGGGVIVAMWKYPSTVFNYLIMSLEDVSTSTPWSNQITSSDYVTIGTQIWTTRNLNVTTYRNGDTIPQVTDPTQWTTITTGAWCFYNNDPATEATYGRLYNWYAINDPRGIGPVGYHVPSLTEWNTLIDNLGGIFLAGGKLKQTGTTNWQSPNTAATNISLFTGLPAGYRGGVEGVGSFDDTNKSTFIGQNQKAYFWTSTPYTNPVTGTGLAQNKFLSYDDGGVFQNNGRSQRNGMSVRFVKDTLPFEATNATSIYNGSSNTNTIISQPWHVSSAAQLCRDYRGGGYTDWYLPSLTELNHGFNAGSVVGTVLGSDTLKGTYWTSTEIDSTKVYAYDFSNTTENVGSRVFAYAEKNILKKARAFRLAQVNERRRPWYPEWEPEYTPIWYNPGGNIWDEGEWIRTSITIDVLPITSEQQANVNGDTNTWMAPQSYVSMTFSNSISTAETVLNSGVCWSKTSTTPTIANSFTYSILTNISKVETYIKGPLVGTPYVHGAEPYFIYFRAFVTTPSGTYYSSNSASAQSIYTGWNSLSGIQSAGVTYSTGTTSYAYYPTGCFTFIITQGFYSRS